MAIEWISVDERLPDDNRHVLVLVDNGADFGSWGCVFGATYSTRFNWAVESEGEPPYPPENVMYWAELNLPEK